MYSVSFFKFHFCPRTLVVGLGVSFSEAGKPLSTLVLFDSNLVSLNPPCCRAALVWKADSNASLGECSRPCKNLF